MGRATLNTQQLNLLDMVANATTLFISKDKSIHVNMYHINATMNTEPRYLLAEIDDPTEVERELLALFNHMNAYANGGSLKDFKAESEQSLRRLLETKEKSLPPEKEGMIDWLHEGLISLLRSAFLVFDKLLLKVGAQKELMRDRGNPFAERWAGRAHFFQHKQPPPPLSEAVLMEQFHETVEKLSHSRPTLDAG